MSMTTRQTPDAVREVIIAAITKADANFGYSYRLTKMDETGEEHTLFMDGFEPAVFQDREDGYPVIEQRRNAARTDAILAAIDSRAGDAGEGFGAVLERWDSVIPLSHDERAKLIAELTAATPAPAVDAKEVALLRTALNEIDQIAGTTIPPDGDAAAWSALEAIIQLIHPFRTNGAHPPRTSPAVDAVPAGEVGDFLPNRPGHCSECGYSRKHAADCSHKREGAIHADRT